MKNHTIRFILAHLIGLCMFYLICVLFVNHGHHIADWISSKLIGSVVTFLRDNLNFLLFLLLIMLYGLFMMAVSISLIGMIIMYFIVGRIKLFNTYKDCNRHLFLYLSITPFLSSFLTIESIPIPTILKGDLNVLFFIITFIYAVSGVILYNLHFKKYPIEKALLNLF